MNDSELEAKLKTAREPALEADYREAFPQTVLARLRSSPWKPRPAQHSWLPRLAWGFAGAVCVLIAFGISHWRGQTGTESGSDVLANAKLIQETLAMFPNRVRAIVQDAHGIRLALSDKGDVPSSSPLYVRICDGAQCSSFVTFSGQEIQFVGEKITVLADARGGIILAGNKFVWSSTAQAERGSQLKIKAKNLGPMAM